MISIMKLLIILFIFISVAKSQESEDCPEPDSIFPCVCDSNGDGPSMACTNITNEDQLEDIFSAEFPEPNMDRFTIQFSEITEITRNVFGNCSFKVINLDTEYITSITDGALENSIDSLILLAIYNCPITSSSFPFTRLDRFTSLTQLRFSNNLIKEFPTIVSYSLQFLFIQNNELLNVLPQDSLSYIPEIKNLDLEGCKISIIEEGAFEGAEQLTYLSLKDNKIDTLSAATFTDLPNLADVNLFQNEIAYIPPGTFDDLPALISLKIGKNMIQRLEISTFGENSTLQILDLIHNNISTIEPGTFFSTPDLELIDLGFNNIATLTTGTFDGLNETSVFVDYNNLANIEYNSFGDLQESYINLQYNEIDMLYEYWLGPLLDNLNYVYLYGNTRISCGCEIAWLFDDPSYQGHVFAQCRNGTFFSDLNPTFYQENC